MIADKIKTLFQAAQNLFADMNSISTDKGNLVYEGDLAIGTKVYIEPGVAAPDGDYIANDNIYVVVDGAISEIKQVEAPVEVQEDPEEEPSVDGPADDSAESPADVDAPDVSAALAEVNSRIDELIARIVTLEAQVAELSGQPKDALPNEFHKVTVAPKGSINVEVLSKVFKK